MPELNFTSQNKKVLSISLRVVDVKKWVPEPQLLVKQYHFLFLASMQHVYKTQSFNFFVFCPV